ncbi:MAG: response regulator [Bacteroidota bacterium]
MQNKLKLLLVEDNESDGALVIRQLEKANYAVQYIRVESRQEIKEALEKEDWDIVISDFSLPQLTAHDSLKVLQESGKDIPFVVVSGTMGEATAVVMMKSGAQDYLMKDNLIRLAPAVGRELADARVRRERNRALLELRESEAKFRAIWENSTDAIGVLFNGIHVFVNPAYVKLYGYDYQEDLFGKSVLNLIAPDERNRIGDYIKLRPVNSTIPSEYETIGLKKDGTTFDVDIKVSFFDYKNEKHTLAIIRDITQRKKIDERLRKELLIRTEAEKRAEESNLVKSSLMMNMSHEVRTPMNAILGFSSLISTESAEEDIRLMAARIKTSGDRLLKTLDDILELAQLQSGSEVLTLVHAELNNEIQGIVKKFRPFADQKKLELKLNTSGKLKACIDLRLFDKAICELLHNAIKFTAKGHVTVDLNIIPFQNRTGVEIRVSDTGIGISKTNHQVIFESFRQVSDGYNRSYEGTGLGLTLSKRIIELLNGELLIDSEIGKGSVFIIRLPVSESQPETDVDSSVNEIYASDEREKTISKKIRKPLILLVEDNEDNIFVTKEFCKNGYVVDAVTNGVDAIQRAREKTYDVILMDINLGLGLDGLQTANEIKKIEKNQKTPIVAMTGFTLKEDRKHILSNGCDYYLGKPFTKNEICGLLESVVHERVSV